MGYGVEVGLEIHLDNVSIPTTYFESQYPQCVIRRAVGSESERVLTESHVQNRLKDPGGCV